MILLDKELPTIPAQLVTNNEAVEIIKKLEVELYNSKIEGIGLAAPQIGINKAVAIIRINSNDPTNPVYVNLVNPIITNATGLTTFLEGCLSFPRQCVKTIRFEEITIETNDYYEYQAEIVNANRHNIKPKELPLFNNKRRQIAFGEIEPGDELGKLTAISVQHEMAHLLGLTFFDFKPEKAGRNDKCICGSEKKNKKCHNYEYFNNNLNRLLKPNYRGL